MYTSKRVIHAYVECTCTCRVQLHVQQYTNIIVFIVIIVNYCLRCFQTFPVDYQTLRNVQDLSPTTHQQFPKQILSLLLLLLSLSLLLLNIHKLSCIIIIIILIIYFKYM